MNTAAADTSLGIVIIGRNEGERLVRCLASVRGFGGQVVYVDSGSTDGSVEQARAAGATVVDLDLSTPFTAARARNAGAAALGLTPDRSDSAPSFIQFVDGDCEVRPDWLATGAAFLAAHPEVAVVSGRLRERHPDASVYNALCDIEWDGPLGETNYCGGIAMMRTKALAQTTLFDARMIAGEEPELCSRLMDLNWKIWRVADEMALHDAAMTRFGQFWSRMRRGGFAYGLWTALGGSIAARLGRSMLKRALVWGAALPVLILLAAIVISPWMLLGLLIYPARIAHLARRGTPWGVASLLVIGKFAEAKGIAEFYFGKWRGRTAGLIEHK